MAEWTQGQKVAAGIAAIAGIVAIGAALIDGFPFSDWSPQAGAAVVLVIWLGCGAWFVKAGKETEDVIGEGRKE